MGVNERREKLARAGAWLSEARSRRYPTAAAFARALGITPSLLSRYETGSTEVPDERAEAIADLLGLDIITVRRSLGLWVPPSSSDETEEILAENERMVRMMRVARELDARAQQAVEDLIISLRKSQNPDRQGGSAH